MVHAQKIGTFGTKVIIHKSRGEVSLVEQDTIENVSAAYLKFIIIILRKNSNFFQLPFMQLFSAEATISKKKYFAYENMKKTPSKVAHNRPK